MSIDPVAMIERTLPAAATGLQDLEHLPPRYSAQLCESCEPGVSAQQIVRAFADAHPEIPDQKIILGLQELAATGLVKVGNPEPLPGGVNAERR